MSKYKNVKSSIKQAKFKCKKKKKRNIDGYKSMSRNQLINLISSTSRHAFEIEKYQPHFQKEC